MKDPNGIKIKKSKKRTFPAESAFVSVCNFDCESCVLYKHLLYEAQDKNPTKTLCKKMHLIDSAETAKVNRWEENNNINSRASYGATFTWFAKPFSLAATILANPNSRYNDLAKVMPDYNDWKDDDVLEEAYAKIKPLISNIRKRYDLNTLDTLKTFEEKIDKLISNNPIIFSSCKQIDLYKKMIDYYNKNAPFSKECFVKSFHDANPNYSINQIRYSLHFNNLKYYSKQDIDDLHLDTSNDEIEIFNKMKKKN